MKRFFCFMSVYLFLLGGYGNEIYSANNIPANNPYIQYYGRWDFSNPLTPTHSWPGVYIYAEFEGTSIGIKTDDNACWYNVFIDGVLSSVFHGDKSGVASYTLSSGLTDGRHTILITLRGETSWTKFAFNGFILDDGKNLLQPPEKPARKIEFIGDSYTSASGNEWTADTAAPNDSYTNIYEGYGPIIARNYDAQYHMTSRGGIGLVLDWQKDYSNNLPSYFDRTLFYTSLPKWDFSQWIPNLIVICLGLNDYNGWGGYSGPIPQENAEIFKGRYHDFISTIMDVYPGAKILAVAANDIDWIKENVSQVVEEENLMGHKNVFYTYFPNYGGFVNNGHPTVETHYKIANQLIATIDTINAWEPYVDTVPPRFVKIPDSPFIVTNNYYVLNVTTDTYARVRCDTQDRSYDQMVYEFTTTGTRSHSTILNCDHNQQYTYYLRAMDAYGNKMDTSAVISFSVDTMKIFLNWKALNYDHSQWKKGYAPLGNDNSGNNATEISSAATVYFRQIFTLDNVSSIKDLRVFIVGHDGAVAYINGEEIGRINIDLNADVEYSTFAINPLAMQTKLVMSSDGLRKLQNGENIFAVEIHSINSASPNISFDAKIYDYLSKTYSPLGSEWFYYDNGNTPSDQITDKTTNIVVDRNGPIPKSIMLFSNYPNPFNPVTKIEYQLPEAAKVTLKVCDMLGREVATLVEEKKNAGYHSATFDGSRFSSGVYFTRFVVTPQEGNKPFVQVKKMLMLK
jgi:hypothetical protein